MDESWRMRMGTTPTKPNQQPRRRSTDLKPEDFNDVFGGPPRSVLSRQFSGGGDRSNLFYDEIFRQRKDIDSASSGRSLPEFRIPGGRRRGEDEFYGDIFGDLRRSRSRSKSNSNSKSKSKSNSLSVLSSEDLSPFRPAIIDDDIYFSSFASKLRPINVSSKWNSSARMHEQEMSEGVPSNCPSFFEKQFAQNDNFRGRTHSQCSGRVSSPEIISLQPNSYSSVKVSVEDLQLNSSSSVVSSLCQDEEAEAIRIQDKGLQEESMEEQEEDEVMSSYVIEINLDNKEGTGEAHGIDEAIAWAKEKCQPRNSDKEESIGVELEEISRATQFPEEQMGRCRSMQSPLPKEWATEEQIQQLEIDTELELLDKDIRLWSAGKEANIRLLLSTLHHILWPNSGWHSMALTDLKENSNVKKAYQKARLCLHPDKLQQRGATFPQKYVAENAFPILQDAWAAFISEDVCSART